MSNSLDGGIEGHLRTRGFEKSSRSTRIIAAILSLTLAFPFSPMAIDQAQAEIGEAMATTSAQHAQATEEGDIASNTDLPAANAANTDENEKSGTAASSDEIVHDDGFSDMPEQEEASEEPNTVLPDKTPEEKPETPPDNAAEDPVADKPATASDDLYRDGRIVVSSFEQLELVGTGTPVTDADADATTVGEGEPVADATGATLVYAMDADYLLANDMRFRRVRIGRCPGNLRERSRLPTPRRSANSMMRTRMRSSYTTPISWTLSRWPTMGSPSR